MFISQNLTAIKMKNNLTLALVATTILFSSCAKKVTASFGYSAKSTAQVEKVENTTDQEHIEVAVLTASVDSKEGQKSVISPEMKEEHKVFFDKIDAHQNELAELEANTTLSSKEKKKATKTLKKEIKSDIKSEMKVAKSSEASDDYILMMILGILIAPIGLGLTYGWGTTEMWIGLVCFLLFWIPGAIYGGYMVHQYFN
tara:strand:- start:1780 stop:2379 length:600 start_codon:yes stop_codon:yes gene_type:complete